MGVPATVAHSKHRLVPRCNSTRTALAARHRVRTARVRRAHPVSVLIQLGAVPPAQGDLHPGRRLPRAPEVRGPVQLTIYDFLGGQRQRGDPLIRELAHPQVDSDGRRKRE